METRVRWTNGESERGHVRIAKLMLHDIRIFAAKTTCSYDRLNFTDENNRLIRSRDIQKEQRQRRGSTGSKGNCLPDGNFHYPLNLHKKRGQKWPPVGIYLRRISFCIS